MEEDLYHLATGGPLNATDEKYEQVLRIMMLDKNYSVAKEKVSCYLASVNHNPAKHDYDGKKLIDGVNRPVEVKPTTYWGGTGKLSMKCSFGDFTQERFERYKEDDVFMVVSGFNRIDLVYAVTFSFNEKPFLDEIQKQMDKVIKGDKRPGTRIIPAPNVNAIAQIEEVNIIYPGPGDFDKIHKHKEAINSKVYQFFKQRLS